MLDLILGFVAQIDKPTSDEDIALYIVIGVVFLFAVWVVYDRGKEPCPHCGKKSDPKFPVCPQCNREKSEA